VAAPDLAPADDCENVEVLRVRPAREDDAAEVAAVHIRAWQVGYRGLLPDDYLDGLRPEDRMGRYTFAAADPDAPSTVVATDDGVIRGFVTTGPSPGEGAERGEVLALYVDPDAWGGGVGRLLMTEARGRLVARGFATATLWVLVGNDRAQRFYRADGWVPDGVERSVEVWNVMVDEVRFVAHLS
jgi:ribosomal protein S18 acetylase RimI-like enzyme